MLTEQSYNAQLNFTSFALLVLEMQTQHHFVVTSRKRSSPERLLYLEAINVTKGNFYKPWY